MNYQKAKTNAITQVNNTLNSFGINLEQFWSEYKIREPKLFREFVDGIIVRDEYRNRRFADILENKVGDSIKDDYEGAQDAGIDAILIDRLSKHGDFMKEKL